MRTAFLAGAVASALSVSPGVPAQQSSTPSSSTPVKRVESLTVTATPIPASEETMAQPVSILEGEALRRKRAPSLGDTLAQEPGVQSSAFGPGAGRPIIRGFDGARVQVLENGVGTLDVSSLSPDHAVTAEPLRARQIEVLRGPATLLYGSGAIGGVVNVVTDTIPRERPAGATGAVELRGASANRQREAAFDVTAPAGASLAVHADAFRRRTKDYDTPKGRLENSFTESEGTNAGASWVGARGFLGVGVGSLESEYGIPSGSGSHIKLEQDRVDLGGELSNPLPGFVRAKLRAGHNDYGHREVRATGEVATTFKNKAWESRFELQHAQWAGLEGALGTHFQKREFSALGEETVVPVTQARSQALFIVERKTWDAGTLEGGARIEREKREPQGDHRARSFNPSSLSAGAVWKFARELDLRLNATRSERAPSIEELYSNGPHDATASFEIGNENLRKEFARTIDVSLRQAGGPSTWKVTFFASRIRNFVFAQSSDADGDGVADRVNEEGELQLDGELLLQNYVQRAARFHGLEAEWSYRPESHAWGVRIFTDAVRGKIEGGGIVPRMAPSRFGLDLSARRAAWSANLTVLRVQAQKRIAELETRTPGYTRVDAELAYEIPLRERTALTVFLQGSNLLDREIRAHTSYLKDAAPLMGRSFALGLRGEF